MIKKYFYFLVVVLLLQGCADNVKPNEEKASSVEPREVAEQSPTEETGTLPLNEPVRVTSAAIEKEAKAVSNKSKNAEVAPAPYKSEDEIVNRLLYLGQVAFDKKRLLTPAHDNANLYYQAALGREPGNYEAIQGISRIIDTYVDWALDAASKQQFGAAYRYLDKAKSVAPQDPLILDTLAQISAKEGKRKRQRVETIQLNDPLKSNRYYLPEDLFRLSEDEILAKMQPIIDRVSEEQDRLVINWANDKEARLLYQIINSRTPDFRVRAMIHHRTDYSIELKPN